MKIYGYIDSYPIKKDSQGRLWTIVNNASVLISRRNGWYGYYKLEVGAIKVCPNRESALNIYSTLKPKHGRIVDQTKVYIYKTDKQGRLKKTFVKLGVIIDEC